MCTKLISVQKGTLKAIVVLLHLVHKKKLLSEVLGGRALQLSQAPRVVPTHKGLLHQAVHQSVLLLVGNQAWSCLSYPGQIGEQVGI